MYREGSSKETSFREVSFAAAAGAAALTAVRRTAGLRIVGALTVRGFAGALAAGFASAGAAALVGSAAAGFAVDVAFVLETLHQRIGPLPFYTEIIAYRIVIDLEIVQVHDEVIDILLKYRLLGLRFGL